MWLNLDEDCIGMALGQDLFDRSRVCHFDQSVERALWRKKSYDVRVFHCGTLAGVPASEVVLSEPGDAGKGVDVSEVDNPKLGIGMKKLH